MVYARCSISTTAERHNESSEQHLSQLLVRLNSSQITCPAHTLDLSPCNFSIWIRLKELVYHEEIVDQNHLKKRTELAFHEMKADVNILGQTTGNMLLHAELCFDNNGGHFENYLE